RWASISSTISASCAGSRARPASRARNVSRQSAMLDPGDQRHRVHEALPGLALALEHAAAVRGQRVVAPPALARPLDPATLQPAALLEPVQQRVRRGDVEHELATGPRLDELADLVAVPWLGLDDRQDDEFGRALFQLAFEHLRSHICHSHTCYVQK